MYSLTKVRQAYAHDDCMIAILNTTHYSLLTSLSGIFFLQCSVDKFVVKCPSLGVIDRIFVGHDNSGFGPGWFLDEVSW